MTALSNVHLKLIKNLYYRHKLSAPEVAKKLKVSPEQIYRFMERSGLNRRSFSEQNAVRFLKKRPSFRVKNRLNREGMKLRTVGAMLYWAEGFQSERAKLVDFANSRPEMILIFLRFLRDICGIDESKLRVYLYCYADQKIGRLISFWSKITGIPSSQFTKPYVRNDFNPQKSGKMKYGLLHIRYGDKKLLDLIRRWIEDHIDEFVKGRPV